MRMLQTLKYHVEVSCIWSFLTKGMNNMVCCILFNLCILQGYLHLPKHPTINYTEGDICLLCCHSYACKDVCLSEIKGKQ